MISRRTILKASASAVALAAVPSIAVATIPKASRSSSCRRYMGSAPHVTKATRPIDVLPGQWICCANGHPIAQASGSAELKLENWQQSKPITGTRVSDLKCEQCGVPFVYQLPKRFDLDYRLFFYLLTT